MGEGLIVTVFIDEDSEKRFRALDITVEEILCVANLKFFKQSIPIWYDFAEVRIERWPRTKNWWGKLFFNLRKFLLLRKKANKITKEIISWLHTFQIFEVLAEAHCLTQQEITKENPDIILLIAGDLFTGEGRAQSATTSSTDLPAGILNNSVVFNGKGIILMGAYLPSDFSPRHKNWALIKYADVLMHEQGHLYGLKHVNEKDTIMYYQFGIQPKEFDEVSQKFLQDILKPEQDVKDIKAA